MSRWTAVLVQTHGAERVDRETNLLSKTHKQPVDLTPEFPGTDGTSEEFLYSLEYIYMLKWHCYKSTLYHLLDPFCPVVQGHETG